MAGKLTNKEYKKRLKISRRYFNFSFDARNKLTPARKAAISRAYNRIEQALEYADSHNLEFINSTRYQKEKFAESHPTFLKTPKGFFVFKPSYMDDVFFVDGALVSENNVYRFVFYPIHKDKIMEFLADPEKWIKRLPNIEKAKGVRINVGALDYLGTQQYQKEQFYKYIIDDLRDEYEEDPEDYVTGVTLVFLK